MRPLLLASAVALASAAVGAAQTLVCPPMSTASLTCDTFHFHTALFRPDTRGYSEVFGVNQFATQTACDRARDAAIRRNAAVVDFFHRVRNDDRYQPDRFGPCHCDMTVERSSPNYLTDAQRAAQFKLEDDVRQRVRERLLDADLPSDNELVRSVTLLDAPAPILGGPKFVPLPSAPPNIPVIRSPNDLRMTRLVESNSPAVASIDLPLVDIPLPGVASSIAADASAPIVSTAGIEPNPTASQPAPQPAPQPQPAAPAPAAQPAQPQPAPATSLPTVMVAADPPVATANDEAAEPFVNFETQRIRNVLAASNSISDESLRSKVLEACVQRIQLLSNLRSLIDGAGVKSRFAVAARAANDESSRLTLVAKLFGNDVVSHWAPKDAADVVVDTSGDPAAAEQLLRDTSGKATAPQKRQALYLVLARTQPTEEQQLWLASVIDSLLQ